MLKLLENISNSNEQSFAKIEEMISELIKTQVKSEDLQEIGDEIRSSNKSIIKILESKVNEMNKSVKQTLEVSKETYRKVDEIGTKQQVLVEKMGELVSQRNEPTVKDYLLELLSVTITDIDDEFPLLDIKLRNIGTKVAFLTMAEIHVDKIWVLRSALSAVAAAIPVSCNYNVLLPLRSDPYTERIELSQAIYPNDVDRFAITIANNAIPGPTKFIYSIRLTLDYDKNKCIQSPCNLFVLTKRPHKFLGLSSPHSDAKLVEYNKNVLTEVGDLAGIKSKALMDPRGYLTLLYGG